MYGVTGSNRMRREKVIVTEGDSPVISRAGHIEMNVFQQNVTEYHIWRNSFQDESSVNYSLVTYVVVVVAGIGLSVISSVKAAPAPTVFVKFHKSWGIDSGTPNAPTEVKKELLQLITTYTTSLGLGQQEHPILELQNTFSSQRAEGHKHSYEVDFCGMGECQEDGDCVASFVNGLPAIIKPQEGHRVIDIYSKNFRPSSKTYVVEVKTEKFPLGYFFIVTEFERVDLEYNPVRACSGLRQEELTKISDCL
ncbi:hypothetical protein EV368DRAFT_67250 [Lentinula lateritia]|nr:hypothetical protein EV368DRAFT_67250 [Lentinula lateritia]